jgi:hypothetical protein
MTLPAEHTLWEGEAQPREPMIARPTVPHISLRDHPHAPLAHQPAVQPRR